MCRPASFVLTEKDIYWNLDDSHENIIKENNLKDSYDNIVRVEIILPDDKHPIYPELYKWEFHVDQDIFPRWYDSESVETRARRELTSWYKKRVNPERASQGVYYVDKESVIDGRAIAFVYGEGKVDAYDKVQVTLNNESRCTAYDCAIVKAYEKSLVQAWGCVEVKAHKEATVYLYGRSHAIANDNNNIYAFGNSIVEAFHNTQVVASDNAFVTVHNNSIVTAGDKTIINAYDNTHIKIYEKAIARVYDKNVKYEIKDRAFVIYNNKVRRKK